MAKLGLRGVKRNLVISAKSEKSLCQTRKVCMCVSGGDVLVGVKTSA